MHGPGLRDIELRTLCRFLGFAIVEIRVIQMLEARPDLHFFQAVRGEFQNCYQGRGLSSPVTRS
jgi:hypothetical protein